MAKYNSIALGKASGKLGNVIFQNYKKMKIVRALNTTTTNLDSPGRLSVKRKFKNLATLWLLFSEFFKYFKLDMKYQESNYNLFVRKYFSTISAQFLASLSVLYGGLITNETNSSDYIGWTSINRLTNLDGTYLYEIGFCPYVPDYDNNLRVRALLCNEYFDMRVIYDVELTETNFNNRQIEISTDDSADFTRLVVYIYCTVNSNCSDIKTYTPFV